MKRILPVIFASALSTFAYSQQQIGNSGFETWEIITGSNAEPTNWNSFLTASGSFSFAASNQITQTSDVRPGSSGTSSARIFSTSVFGVIANGNLTTGRINMGSGSAVNAANYNSSIITDVNFSEALTDTPDSIVFWVKFTPVTSTSQARAAIILHDTYAYHDGGTVDAASTPHTVATAYLNYGTTNGQWVRKSVPFTYSGPATVNTFVLATFTTNMTPGGGNANDQVWVDDVQLIYNPVTSPIAADPDMAATMENAPVSIDVTDNDSDAVNGIDNSSVAVTTVPSNGTTSVNSTTGFITYTPNPGFFGTDTFIYTVCNLGNPVSCDTALVTVTVNGLMNAVDDLISTLQDEAISIPVLDNDTDPENAVDATSVVIVTAPLHGTTSIDATTGVITYTPDAGYFGPDSFLYMICDNGTPATCAEATVTINVIEVIAGVNNQIIANNDAVTTVQDVAAVIDVVNNDIDPEDMINASSVAVTVAALHGTTSVNSTTGMITYTPDAGYSGSDVFTYNICDAGTPAITCDDAVVTVTITSTVGTDELTAENIGVAFVNDQLLITSPEVLMGTAAIYSASGQLVQTSALSSEIAFRANPGIYFVQIHCQFGTISRKVVRN